MLGRTTAGPRNMQSTPLDRNWSPADVEHMRAALALAQAAEGAGEVPVGAIVTAGGRIVGRGCNRTIVDCDPTAHAEIVALREAARATGNHRLAQATMYVTLEPCSMCAGALVLAKVKRLVFAAADPKTGMCGSLGCIVQDRRLNHRMQLTAGVLADPAAELLRGFFRARR